MVTFLLVCQQGALAQSIEMDKQLGAENSVIVEAQMGIYNDDKLNDYVRQVGNRLVAALDKQVFNFQFKIVDDPIPNAFALPGGYVYVSRGLLSLIVTEDELACVMGHEIIHVTRRHSVKQMKRGLLGGMLQLPGKVVGRVVSEDLGNLVNAPIQTGSKLFQSSYSRKHETESDSLGITMASKAGYDPNAMAGILDRISKAVEILTQQKEERGYFDDHPYTPSRVKSINSKSRRLKTVSTEKIAPDFPTILEGMVMGENPDKGVFRENLFIHPVMDFEITFPKGWVTSNQASTVGAVFNGGQAAIFVGLVDSNYRPDVQDKAFAEKIENEYRGKVARSEPVQLNGNEAYLVSLFDYSSGAKMYIHVLWTRLGNDIFQLIGLAPESLNQILKDSAESLRILSPAEKHTILRRTVHIVEARDNESIEQLIQRSSNIFKPELVLLINNLEAKTILHRGQKIKVIQESPY